MLTIAHTKSVIRPKRKSRRTGLKDHKMSFISETSLRCQKDKEVQMSGSQGYESPTALEGQEEVVNLGVISLKVISGTLRE